AKVILVNLLLIISTSTSGFYGYFIFIAFSISSLLFFSLRKNDIKPRKNFFLLISSAFSVFLVFFFLYKDIFISTFWKFFNQSFLLHSSFRIRWEGFVAAWNVFLENLLIGVGW